MLRVSRHNGNYIVRVPRTKLSGRALKVFMETRGLNFSIPASTDAEAVLYSSNAYAVADLPSADGSTDILSRRIAASRAMDGEGTDLLPPGKELAGYQRACVDYLGETGSGLVAEPPGAGKTIIAMAHVNAQRCRRVLVLCPAGLRLQWRDQILAWTTLANPTVDVIMGASRAVVRPVNFLVVGYPSVRNPALARQLMQVKWDCIIADEAHALKNEQALTTKIVLGNSKGEFRHGRESLPALRRCTQRLVLMTGTPILNRPAELFNAVLALGWEAIDFSSREAFKRRYNFQKTVRKTKSVHTIDTTNFETELQNRLRANIMVRHAKADILPQLKAPRYSVLRVEPGGAIQQALETENLLDIDLDQLNANAQVFGHIAEARRLMGEAMAPVAAEYAYDFLDGGDEKLVVFAWHKSVVDFIVSRLADFGAVAIDGSASMVQRKKSLDIFIRDPECRVLVANLVSGGVGLDGMQGVCYRCLVAEPDWVPAINEQAIARLDRIGQANQVQAEFLVARNSIAERILKRSIQKLHIIDLVLDQQTGKA